MNSQTQFFNPRQPQTLQIGVILLYFNAFFALLGGIGAGPGLLLLIAMAGGAFGIANEKKWGYQLGVGAAVVNVLLLFAYFGAEALTFPVLINTMVDGALVALLLHPMSRDYQRIWFE